MPAKHMNWKLVDIMRDIIQMKTGHKPNRKIILQEAINDGKVNADGTPTEDFKRGYQHFLNHLHEQRTGKIGAFAPNISYSKILFMSVSFVMSRIRQTKDMSKTKETNILKRLNNDRKMLQNKPIQQYSIQDWEIRIYFSYLIYSFLRDKTMQSQDIQRLKKHFQATCHHYIQVVGNSDKALDKIDKIIKNIKANGQQTTWNL